jgi:hypothetical protein
MKIRPDFMNTEIAFVVEMLSFSVYSYWYWYWNQEDKYQLHFLVAAVVFALLPILFLEVGPLIGVFCVMPRAVLSSLVLSDFFHLALKVSNKSRVQAEEAVSGEKV